MEDFIRSAASELGISEESSRSATSGLLGLLKENTGGSDFSELLNKVPGAQALLDQAPAAGGDSGGGLMGGLLGKVTAAVGMDSGAAGLASVISNAGLDLGSATGFVGQFVGYLKGKAGGDVVGRLLNKVPDLKNLVS